MRVRGSWFIALCLSQALVVSAQEVATQPAAPPETPYEGVSPLTTNEPPFPEKAAHSRVLTWPGFERNADGCFRVFFQLSEPAQWINEKTETGLAIIFKNTKTHLRNTTRPLDMTYFDAPVTMVHVTRRGKDVVANIVLRDIEQVPRLRTLSQEKTGYHFLLAEFKCADDMPAPTPAQKPAK